MTSFSRVTRRVCGVVSASAALSALVLAGFAPAANAETKYPSDTNTPNLVQMLSGYNALWTSDGKNDLHGTVLNAGVLTRNDQITSWINQHATSKQQFRALQNSAYLSSDGSGYDQSITIADGLGKKLGAYYVKGRNSGALPKVTALINSSNGTTGAYVGTSTAKGTFSYPRPFLPVSASAAAVPGDDAGCAPSIINGSSLASIRQGKDWTDASGNLKITRVAPVTDTTHEFSSANVALDPGYGSTGICTGGSFPSGHTTTAYQAGITLATLLPELAPSILARTSEAGNNRIVLGVHYPLDIMGGRMDGETALAARWSDSAFRKNVLEPARTELVNYLKKQCKTTTLSACIAKDTAYTDNPYGGAAMPGGTSQIVTNRASAIKVYTERLTYGFSRVGTTGLAASVPTGAENLLLTTYPTLTASQRRQILAQTELPSGYPLDTTAASLYGAAPKSWQRLNLAKAMSAKVQIGAGGNVKVLSTGGRVGVTYTKAAQRKVNIAVKIKNVKVGKRPTVTVTVTQAKVPKVAATGSVKVDLSGKTSAKVKLSNGKATFKLAKLRKSGKKSLKTTFSATGPFKSKSLTKHVTVRK